MMPQQVQLVQPQFQMMSNQPTMLVNPQGQLISGGQNQLQIINHGAVVPQSGQSGQQVHTVPSGATLVQAGSQQLANGTVTIQLAEQKVKIMRGILLAQFFNEVRLQAQSLRLEYLVTVY